jgi:peptidoglycan/LPS O-acetylase OafA/YrhL
MLKNFHRNLNGLSSIYLDVLRLCCALVVFFGHSILIIENKHSCDRFAHFAVICFFVLSGFVIAHTTSVKKRTLKEYAVARLSRLYSILIPAIILTALCGYLSYLFDLDIFLKYSRGYHAVRLFLVSIFATDFWFTHTGPPNNGPLWSLGYEFWYYVLFGIIYFWNKKKRMWWWILLIVIIVCIGPKILLLMPVWLFGWTAYHFKKINLPIPIARLFFVLLLSIATILTTILPALPYQIGGTHFHFSNQFITDWILGLIVAFALCLLPTQHERQFGTSIMLKKFRLFGNLTYPIYVFHYPILILSIYLSIFTTLVTCVLLGLFFESKKTWWDKLFDRLIIKLSKLCKKHIR